MIVLMLIVVVCLVFLSSLVATQGFNKAPNKALILSIFLLCIWVIMVFGLQRISGPDFQYQFQLVYSRIVFLVGALSLLSLVWFVATLLTISRMVRLGLGASLLVIAGLMTALSLSPYTVSSVAIQSSATMPFPVYGQLMPAYIGIISIAVASVAFMVIWGSVREKQARRRKQLRVVGISITSAIVVGVFTNLFVPWLTGDTQSSLYMTISILMLVVGLSHAIIRHGLFDIKIAAVRTFGYALTVSLLTVVYAAIALVISAIFFQDANVGFAGNSTDAINIILALLLAIIYQPVKQFFNKLTNGIFYRDTYDSEAFYSRLSGVITADSTDLQGLLRHVAEEVEATLKAERVFFYVRWGEHHTLVRNKGRLALSGAEFEQMNAFIAENGEGVIVRDMVPVGSGVRKMMTARDIEVAVPLMQKSAVLGYMLLGIRRSSKYAGRDIKVLETISNELSIAIQNALTVQDIKELNDTLQLRIDEATSELRTSNDQLKRLDEAKDEFVSMASHQLRTPLTSVKGYISMVLEGDAGEITPVQRKLLGEAFTSSERMVHLISDFLNVSRLQTGKFILETVQINLADIVKQEVESLGSTAKAHSVKLQFRKPTHFPVLFLDEGKIRQVVMNFIDNAIYYSPERTSITVGLTIEEGNAVFTVRDNGIGVPKDQQGHLFTKFFRADNARRQRPDGTGVGLFLAKKVIIAHGGSIVFESTEGEGSTFGFRLPIKKLSEAPAPEVEAPSEMVAS